MKHQFHMSAIAHRERNDPDAARRHEWITAGLMMAFVVAVMVCAAIVGDDNQQERLAAERERLQAELIAEGHMDRSHWADYPNTSRCGWNCISRLPVSPESWEWAE